MLKIHSDPTSENNDNYRALFNSMAEGFALHEIITNDLGEPVDYRFIQVNPSFERMTGKSKKQVVGKRALEIFPDIEGVWIERFGRVALSGMPERFVEYCHELGRWYEVFAYSPSHGKFAAVFTDITDLKNLEEKLKQSQNTDSIGTMAGGVAHDFNNILTVIMGAGAMLQMKLTEDSELVPYVNQILNSSERAAKLTQNLLAYSRKQPIKPLLEDVNDLIDVMYDFLSRIIGNGINLETICCKEPLPVNVDRGLIEQVFLSLAANARDSMPDGGVLRLETCRADMRGPSKDFDGCLPGTYVVVTMADSGLGMDEATLSRIFEPFFTTKESGCGSGMGLSMAYGIIKQHGGTIKASSNVGEGSVFRIYLPLRIGSF